MNQQLRVWAVPALLPIVLYAVLAVLVVPVFPHFTSPNELSRWLLAVAIVDFQTIEITPVLAATGLTRIEDLSTVGGRVYSNKAPGAALTAVPAYAIARIFTGPASAMNLRPTVNAMRLAAASIPAVLLAFWLAAAAGRLGCDGGRIRTAVVVLLFATPLFAYGLLFFAHALSAMALFGIWALLFVPEGSPKRDIAAGALIGLAVVTEYPNAIAAAVLAICALPRLRLAGALRLIAGGLPFALLLGLYNRAAFGSFFALSSAFESDPTFRELSRSGIFGVGFPTPANLIGLLVDPSKGLLILSPVLLFALAGLPSARRAMSRSAFVALLAAPFAMIVTIAGYPNWHGGWTVGARYLVAAIPFLVLLIAFAAGSLAETFALGASVAAVAVVSLVFPFVPPDYPAPWISFSWPILREGLVAPNLLHFVARPLAIAVPFSMVIAALLIGANRRRHRALAAAGIVVWLAAGLIAQRSESRPPVARALITEVYFEREGAIRETLPPAPGIERLEAHARQLRQAPPPGWPF